jgi:hypothetical protein
LKSTSLFMFLFILVLGCVAAPAWADVVPVNNPSFEMTSALNLSGPTYGKWNKGPITSWTLTGEGGSWQPDTVAARSYSSVPAGMTVAYSNGGTIYQDLSASLLSNTTYTLSVDVGHRLDGLETNYTLAIYAGGNLLIKSADTSNGAIPIGTFADETVTFTSGANVAPGQKLRIVLTSTGQQTDFDDVSLTASAIPEPASLSLLAAGCGLMLFVFRRR